MVNILKNLKIGLAFFSLVIFSILTSQNIQAQTANSEFITIVNPVRTITNKTPAKSLAAQYNIVSAQKLPATWLLSFDALANRDLVEVVKKMDKAQEFGILLEVSSDFAKAAGVEYNLTDSWHRANSVFLSGYTQADRKKLIDTVFSLFKDQLGFTPSSVGAWWVDSFSLSYLKEKYQITASLTVADQFQTDGYQVWGQYWSTPFYPSRYHAAIPASTDDTKLDIVVMQWAARDPLSGYGGGAKESTYSIQDYLLHKLDLDYLEKLLRLYGEKHDNKFGQVILGLEADLPPNFYTDSFDDHLSLVKKLADSGQFKLVAMREFSQWYRQEFPNLSPTHTIAPTDLLGSEKRAIWYQSPNYRIGLQTGPEGTKIIDFRTYHPNLEEPYYIRPNRQIELSVYVPSLIDHASVETSSWQLDSQPVDKVTTRDGVTTLVTKSGKSFVFSPEKIEFEKVGEIPKIITQAKTLQLKKDGENLIINLRKNWLSKKEGVTFRGLTLQATHFISQKRIIAAITFVAISIVVFLLVIAKTKIKKQLKLVIGGLIIVGVVAGAIFWLLSNSKIYYLSQEEVDGLFQLSTLSKGKVLISDSECLQCSWQTEFQPAVFANNRGYVKKLAKKPTVDNQKFFTATTREEARKELDKSKARYIYLVQYEDYLEKLPFLPADLGLVKVYQNSAISIWKVE